MLVSVATNRVGIQITAVSVGEGFQPGPHHQLLQALGLSVRDRWWVGEDFCHLPVSQQDVMVVLESSYIVIVICKSSEQEECRVPQV